MVYHYLSIYHESSDKYAKDRLLYEFGDDNDIEAFTKAIIEFKNYSFQNYPNQEELKAEIENSYFDKKDKCYYWSGIPYYSYEDLYKDLSKQKRLMSLDVEVLNF